MEIFSPYSCFGRIATDSSELSFLLAVADLFVGFTEPISIGAFVISGHLVDENLNSSRTRNISAAFQITFGFGSVLILTLISLERAYALIWPLRHRAASRTRSYIYSVTLAWLVAIFTGALTLLTAFDILDFTYWTLAAGSAKVLCLVTISVSCLAIRSRLNCNVPAIDGVHNRKNEPQRNAKLSRTLFIMITASRLFWVPSLVVHSTQYLCDCVPLLVYHIFTLFRLANSLVNPIIYSFKIPMFKKTVKRAKLCK